MDYIDLRSDTVTHPTPEMLQAMLGAPLGDDVYEEDPTVNRLQELAAERMGKEAGLFVASGTMGNLVAILTHCGRGDEIILGNLSHTFLFEAGGTAALGGVHSYVLPNQADGSLLLDDIRDAIRSDNVHYPTSRLLCLENTHNRCGGVVLSPEYTQAAAALAHENGLKVHLDGARVFNAAAALAIPVSALTLPVDSVTFCLSKALCAPVGSVLCGTADFIRKARHIRKQLGGGMRQAGVLAAAGIIAIEKMADLLPEDHHRARMLAEGLGAIPGVRLDFGLPVSNMVFFSLDPALPLSAKQVAERLEMSFIKVGVTGNRSFRLVTHYWIKDTDIQKTVDTIKEVLSVQG
ncbi:MAG TPA: low-specificity L-threonine aldolase [Anaerolineaceae bacterium]